MKTTATLDQIIKEYLSEQTVQSTSLRTYKTYLVSFYRYCDVVGVDKRNLSLSKLINVLRYVEQFKSRNYHISLIIILKKYFAWLEDKGYWNNVAKGLRVPARRKTHSKDALNDLQLMKLLSVLDRTRLKGKRDYAIIMLMLLNGLRCIEVSRANQCDLVNKYDSEARRERICLELQRKGHTEKDDFIQIENVYHKALEDYISDEKYISNESLPLFLSQTNERLTPQTIGKIVTSYLIKSGIKNEKITTHSLRHTSAVISIKDGVDIYDVQKFLGHTKTEITEIYASMANDSVKLKNNPSESILKTIESLEHELQS